MLTCVSNEGHMRSAGSIRDNIPIVVVRSLQVAMQALKGNGGNKIYPPVYMPPTFHFTKVKGSK